MLDPCEDNQCTNGGICFPSTESTYVCRCPRGYEGQYCQEEGTMLMPCYLQPSSRTKLTYFYIHIKVVKVIMQFFKKTSALPNIIKFI